MVYRELRETCSKLGEEMFSKSAEAGSKGTNYGSYIPPDPKPGGYNLCL